MRKFALGLLALFVLATQAFAGSPTRSGDTWFLGSERMDLGAALLMDSAGNQIGIASNPFAFGGNVASGATDSGNPAKFGCVYNSTLPTVTTGQRVDCQSGTRGSIDVTLFNQDGAVSPAFATSGADGVSNASATLTVTGRTGLFNGSTWDRAFTCTNSVVVNVTAAATTQLVALQASQVIRVCSFSVSMSAAGTAQFVYGTGSNCGTGTTNLTGVVTLATGTPWGLSAPEGGSLFRTASANALCLAAVTGNVTGFVTYAQY